MDNKLQKNTNDDIDGDAEGVETTPGIPVSSELMSQIDSSHAHLQHAISKYEDILETLEDTWQRKVSKNVLLCPLDVNFILDNVTVNCY